MEYLLDVETSNGVTALNGAEIITIEDVQVTDIYVEHNGEEYLVWTYDRNAPIIVMQQPTNLKEVAAGSITFRGTVGDTQSGVASISAKFQGVTVPVTLSNGTWTSTFNTTTISNVTTMTTMTFTLTATDIAGNVGTASTQVKVVPNTLGWADDFTPINSAYLTSKTATAASSKAYTEQQSGDAYTAVYTSIAGGIRKRVINGCTSVSWSGSASNGAWGNSTSFKIYRCDGTVVYSNGAWSGTVNLAANGWNTDLYYVETATSGSDNNYGYSISAAFSNLSFA